MLDLETYRKMKEEIESKMDDITLEDISAGKYVEQIRQIVHEISKKYNVSVEDFYEKLKEEMNLPK